jgi:SAM-dependent methyltransferase
MAPKCSNRCHTLRFAVANVNELDLPSDSFDVAHFHGVLMYLSEPERALELAFRSLKSGGMVAAGEAYVAGNWAAGPNADSVELLMRTVTDGIKAQGGDPLIGRQLRALIRKAGFERVVSQPCYSAALSDVKSFSTTLRAGWSGNWRPILLRQGITEEQCDQLIEDASIWADSEDSIIAAAECAVIGWKP